MPVIKAQKIPKGELPIEDTIMRFCYHYPQYTYAQAKQLPFTRIRKMLTIARREQALVLYNIVRAAAAPHTKKGAGVKQMLGELKNIIEE